MHELVDQFAQAAALAIEAAAIVIVAFGALEAFLRIAATRVRPAALPDTRKAIWRSFGIWLLLGLEFELAADIIKTVVSPTWQDIGELAAIAVIRTFLNLFLERDLDESATPPRQKERTADSATSAAKPA
jgi:uncharacterized membrane protein